MERLTTLFNDVRLSDRVRGLARWQNPVAASPAAPLETVAALFTLEPVTDVDTSAADVIQSLHDDLDAAGIELHFAEVKAPVKDRLKRYGLLEQLGPERFHPTVGTAVDAYVAETGVAWREEDSEPNAGPEGR